MNVDTGAVTRHENRLVYVHSCVLFAEGSDGINYTPHLRRELAPLPCRTHVESSVCEEHMREFDLPSKVSPVRCVRDFVIRVRR